MGLRVMVVDNAPFARERLRRLLETHGYEVIAEAKDTREAVAQYRKLKPDIVTVDMLLDGELGLQTMDRLRKEDPNARMIVVSAMTDKSSIDNALAHGAVAYVSKTDDWRQVEAALKKAAAK